MLLVAACGLGFWGYGMATRRYTRCMRIASVAQKQKYDYLLAIRRVEIRIDGERKAGQPLDEEYLASFLESHRRKADRLESLRIHYIWAAYLPFLPVPSGDDYNPEPVD
jgi:hypothetical protein